MTKVPTLSDARIPQPTCRPEFVPSPQQSAIFQWALHGEGSAIVEAVAGAGKTTTLIKVCEIISYLNQSAAFCAFNKKIAQDIAFKLDQAGISSQTVTSGTFHAIGLKALTSSIGRVKVDGRKIWTIMDRTATPRYLQAFVANLVSLGKQHGANLPGQPYSDTDWQNLVDHFDLADKINAPDDDSSVSSQDLVELGIYWTQQLLKESSAYTAEIDFDDMLYLPLLLGSRVPQFDWVLVDEAQDTNFVRRELTKRMLKPGGRLVAVGDHHQAIYGFTGASHDALTLINDEFQCKTLPLTVTYRCPRSVVAFAQRWVSHIQAHESAPEGSVSTITMTDFDKLRPGPDSAILCRNTKPLVTLAFDLIRRKIPCHVEGREIGQGLLKLANKWQSVTIQDLDERLTKYLTDETYRLIKRGQEQKAQDVQDKVMTLRVLMEELSPRDSVHSLTTVVNSLFKDTNGGRLSTVTLSTIHKAKGREWPIVYLLDRANLMPSPYAKQEWQLAQEINLMYVAVTRAQHSLIEILLPSTRRK